MKRLLLLVALALFACPKPPPPPPPPPPVCAVWSAPEACTCPTNAPLCPILGVCAPPRVDRPIDWGAARGLTAFSITHKSLEDLVDYVYKTHEKGWTLHRAGAQARWPQACPGAQALKVKDDLLFALADSGYLTCGPAHGTPEADANLIRILEVTARIPNTWVQVIASFTYKHIDLGSSRKNVAYFNGMFDQVNAIVKAGGYKHVVFELFNEVVHPISSHITPDDVVEMFKHARANTNLPVGTDHHGIRSTPEWLGRYPPTWRRHATYIAFHTPRNPEPTYAELRESQSRYNYVKPVFVDETVCWASQKAVDMWDLRNKGTIAMRGFGTEQERMNQCIRHLRRVHKNGWKALFHTIWGIHGRHIGQMPDYDAEIKQR